MTPIHVEFLMNEGYLRDFQEEWVSAVGRGWRASRRIAAGLIVASLVLAPAGWSMNWPELEVFAAGTLLLSLVMVFDMNRRRAAWLRHCRSLPWYGRVLRIEVRDGDLVQVKDAAGDPRFERTGALILTPNGYLVRYRGVIDHVHRAISTTNASIYIPHRAIVPSMTREAFLASLRFLEVADG